jgi:hypothetical protein
MESTSVMDGTSFKILASKIVIRVQDRVCETEEELLSSELCREMIRRAIKKISDRHSFLIDVFGGKKTITDEDINTLIETFKFLSKMPRHLVPNVVKGSDVLLKDPNLFNDFVEYLYNYWRSYDRFLIAAPKGKNLDKRPYRTFNETIGHLTTLIRGMYRDIQENITGKHPRIYRQVAAGAEVSSIAVSVKMPLPAIYEKLNSISVIRQILIFPPLILNPPMNKRTGKFERIQKNPLEHVNFNDGEWLCYPAKVGPLLIMIYFHNKFAELGHALCNLFQLAEDEDLKKKPDAVYAYGVPGDVLDNLAAYPTVFYDDKENNMLVAAVPQRDEFGYFGYLKKMVLTLHNIIMMKRNMLPFHGALVRLVLEGNKDKTILFMGDTGAGKSETLEALREVGEEKIQDLIIIADDMGSLDFDKEGDVIGYGTEIGAFLRLDDLQPGYALGQIDRAIIMSPNQVNARIILPVTTFDNVMFGHKIDYILYANNYDDIDEDHPIMERFGNVDKALSVFREGMVMSKGTTTSTGIVHSYFANIFGPPQYKELHEPLAQKFFQKFFEQGIYVGQMRTRLGLQGWERNGPLDAAKELLRVMSK